MRAAELEYQYKKSRGERYSVKTEVYRPNISEKMQYQPRETKEEKRKKELDLIKLRDQGRS